MLPSLRRMHLHPCWTVQTTKQRCSSWKASSQALESMMEELSASTSTSLIPDLQQSLAAHDAAMEELRAMVSAAPDPAQADQSAAARSASVSMHLPVQRRVKIQLFHYTVSCWHAVPSHVEMHRFEELETALAEAERQLQEPPSTAAPSAEVAQLQQHLQERSAALADTRHQLEQVC